MRKSLLGLAVLILIAGLVILTRFGERDPQTTPDGIETPREPPEAPRIGSSRPDDSGYRELMARTTQESGSSEQTGRILRSLALDADPSALSFREIESLLDRLSVDPSAQLLLTERALAQPEHRWSTLERRWLVRLLGRLTATVDSGSLQARMEQMGTGADRIPFVQGAAETLSRKDLGEGLEWIGTLEAELRGPALHGLGRAWADSDVEKALEWARNEADPGHRLHAMKGIVSGWAQADPEAAYRHVMEAEGEFRDALLVEMAASTARTDSVQAVEWVIAAHRDPMQFEVLEDSVTRWVETDFDEASEWCLNRIPRSDLRDAAMVAVIDHMAITEPETASEWASKYPTVRERGLMAERSLVHWARESPVEAANWYQTHNERFDSPNDPLDFGHIVLVRKVVDSLGQSDPDAARTWVASLTEPSLRNAGEEALGKIPDGEGTPTSE